MENENNRNRLRVTGLWWREDRNGDSFLSGSLSQSLKLLIFKNSFKHNPNDPDYHCYLAWQQRKKSAASQEQEVESPVKPEPSEEASNP